MAVVKVDSMDDTKVVMMVLLMAVLKVVKTVYQMAVQKVVKTELMKVDGTVVQ